MFLHSVCIFILGMITQQVLTILGVSTIGMSLFIKAILFICVYFVLSAVVLEKTKNEFIRDLFEGGHDVFLIVAIWPLALMYGYYRDTVNRIKRGHNNPTEED